MPHNRESAVQCTDARSQFRRSKPKSEAAMSARRVRSILRRRASRMDGGPAEGSVSRCCGGTARRGGEDFTVAGASSSGMAAEGPRAIHFKTPFSCCQFCKVIRHRCWMLGIRVGEASHPGPREGEPIRFRRLRPTRSTRSRSRSPCFVGTMIDSSIEIGTRSHSSEFPTRCTVARLKMRRIVRCGVWLIDRC